MKRIANPTSIARTDVRRHLLPKADRWSTTRNLHATTATAATVAPITASAPPPPPPTPSADFSESRIARRRKQAELLKRGQELKAGTTGLAGGKAAQKSKLQKRFWKDVHIREIDDALEVHLDQRPLRTPTKEILRVPRHKPHLAAGLALEWDLLVSAQQALKVHLIPLTSLVSRALDIVAADAAPPADRPRTRHEIVSMLMRYLETDSLLCWAPEAVADPPGYEQHERRTESLKTIQMRTARPIIHFLTERVFPGVDIVPVLEDGSIMPRAQPPGTKEVIQGWLMGLPAFELAGVERATLAAKSLLLAVRLVVQWSTELGHLRAGTDAAAAAAAEAEAEAEKAQDTSFGIDEAEKAASLEVTYQTDMWGMVEDSHDVQKEDLRRQLGSAILLVS